MEKQRQVVLGARVDKGLHARILSEQQRITKLTGIKPSINEVVKLLIERGLEVNGKRR